MRPSPSESGRCGKMLVLLLASVLFLAASKAADALSVPSSSRSPAKLTVWDAVIENPEQRATLHEHASKSGLEHKCFSRPLADTKGNNIIERTLDAVLTEIESGSASASDDEHVAKRQYVEYWTRQEWRHIEGHADVDENLSKQMDQQSAGYDAGYLTSEYPTTYRDGHRYPINGHVLYLQVGSDVKGPTCVFPGRSSGGDLLRGMDERYLEEEECSDDSENRGKGVQMVSVPAVDGRLLRFDGSDLHAVPRPHDLWMLPFVKGGAEYEPEEVWGRSVILFNVWPCEEKPPLDVPLDRIEEDLPESQMPGFDYCNPFDKWKEVEVGQSKTFSAASGESNQNVKIWLLGNERRRDHPLRTVPLLAPAEGGRKVNIAQFIPIARSLMPKICY